MLKNVNTYIPAQPPSVLLVDSRGQAPCTPKRKMGLTPHLSYSFPSRYDLIISFSFRPLFGNWLR